MDLPRCSLLAALAISTLACNVSTLPSRPDDPSPTPEHAGRRDAGPRRSSTRDDAPEISRSRGVEGGAVVLYPRVIPRGDDPELEWIAGGVQRRLERLARLEHGDRVERRPEPERVCPREGCLGTSYGAVVAKKGEGCTVVAVIGAPGPSPLRLVPWVGGVRLASEEVPFREPPENAITITEHARCADLLEALASNAPLGDEGVIQQAIRRKP